MTRRIRLDFMVKCSECGQEAPAFSRGDRYWTHCLVCGSMWHWTHPGITDRASHGRPICIHNPPLEECRRGYMKSCRICLATMFKPPILEPAKGILMADTQPIGGVSSGA